MEPDSTKSWHRFKRLQFKSFDQNRAKNIEQATARHAHKFLVGRLSNLQSVRRRIISWLLLVSLLIGLTILQMSLNQHAFTVQSPAETIGYSEGVVGPINTLNPLFTSNATEQAATKLLFSGLLKYDENGVLQNDLAEQWRVENKGKRYVVTLKPGLTWHDGRPLTAADVAFTIKTIQNPRVGALAGASWRGIKVDALGDRQIIFTLSAPYAPFASALTFPIIPEHILSKIPPEALQEDEFGKRPIGSGPFRYANTHTIDISSGKSALQLDGFQGYWEGSPRIGRFSLYTYSNQKDLQNGLNSHEINAAVGLTQAEFNKLHRNDFQKLSIPLNNGVYALFRTDIPTLKDARVRQALTHATNTKELTEDNHVMPLEGPFINTQLHKANQVKQLTYNVIEANKLLDAAGWKKNKLGIREKDGQKLELKVVAINKGRYKTVVDRLAEQWKKVGVAVDAQIVDPEQVQQNILLPRAYDVLVYELQLGGDADGYAFWHSSQGTSAGLNFSGYSSNIADDALITARSDLDVKSRDAKYAIFAKQWAKDAPAIGLYQSTLSYVKNNTSYSLNTTERLVSQNDRYANVAEWSNRNDQEYITP